MFLRSHLFSIPLLLFECFSFLLLVLLFLMFLLALPVYSSFAFVVYLAWLYHVLCCLCWSLVRALWNSLNWFLPFFRFCVLALKTLFAVSLARLRIPF